MIIIWYTIHIVLERNGVILTSNTRDELAAIMKNLNMFRLNFEYLEEFHKDLISEENIAKFPLKNHRTINANMRKILIKWIV